MSNVRRYIELQEDQSLAEILLILLDQIEKLEARLAELESEEAA